MDHSLPGGYATISVESLVILDFSSLSNVAMVVALDRGPHGGYTTILVGSLVALGITPLEFRFGFQIVVYSAVAPLSQWNRL